MNILFSVFDELNYQCIETFNYVVEDTGIATKYVAVHVFQDKNQLSQVILLCDCENSLLRYFAQGNIVEDIAYQFRKMDRHDANMDKNASLVLACWRRNDETADLLSKVLIEDDPYYFRKFVFLYSEQELEKTKMWLLKNMKPNGSYISQIQSYITNTDNFANFKSGKDDGVYSFLAELVTKISFFPINMTTRDDIESIDEIMKHQLEKVVDKKGFPIHVDVEKIEKLIGLCPEFENVEEICSAWNEL